MLVFVANLSCPYPFEAIVIMSFASIHAMRTSVNNQTKQTKIKLLKFSFLLIFALNIELA